MTDCNKHWYIFILPVFMTAMVSACHSTATDSASALSKTRANYYSNTLLSSSDSLHRKIVQHIRFIGGEVYQSGSFVTIIIPNDAVFEPTKAVTLPQAGAIIEDVSTIIADFPNTNVIITVHTDDIDSPLSQAKLTHQQAQLFAMLLWQQESIDLKTFQRFKYAGMAQRNRLLRMHQSMASDSIVVFKSRFILAKRQRKRIVR
ncbi:MAG: hypothetical protein LRY67_00330 [Gammaproteobacteria bacterium]|nr:hypothetical protein [Gammaproteobacteria bacterium]